MHSISRLKGEVIWTSERPHICTHSLSQTHTMITICYAPRSCFKGLIECLSKTRVVCSSFGSQDIVKPNFSIHVLGQLKVVT